ncbi:ATP synthase subunit I [Paenibacillus sp. TRM 82003]|nr:ATP synthase subunit I [Paenibacillus sp. TRM 82003]MCI3923472.1 ATP synthase subunit I [Paenibacillus sp. TRM 82003]
MDDLNELLRKVGRITSLFLSFCLLAWAFAPEGKAVFAGLAVGVTGSFVNALYLSGRVKRIANFALGSGRRTGVGFWTRVAVALVAVFAAIKFPEIDLYAVVAGLFFVQLATLLLGIISNAKNP